jgi:hypothetical protein
VDGRDVQGGFNRRAEQIFNDNWGDINKKAHLK